MRVIPGAAPGCLTGGAVRPGGFSLIEALVALAILSIGIIVVLQVFQTSLTAAYRTRTTARAVMLAGMKMSEIRLAAVSVDKLDDGYSSGVFDEPWSDYFWSVNISRGDDAGRDGYGYHDVVIWISSAAGEKIYTLTGRVAEPSRVGQGDTGGGGV